MHTYNNINFDMRNINKILMYHLCSVYIKIKSYMYVYETV